MNISDAAPSLNYKRLGQGPPLVLLHGIGHRWQAWEPVLGKLAAEHDVIAVDLPGFGASPQIGGAHTPRALAAAIARFTAHLGLDRPHVAGNSLGGAIALELAADRKVASATALSPAGFWSRPGYWYAVAVFRVLRGAALAPPAVLETVAHQGALRALAFGLVVRHPARLSPQRVLGDAVALRDGPAFRAVARQMRSYELWRAPRVPATVAWGTNDLLLLHRQARQARRRLPGVRHVELPGCGHVPMSDDPDLVASTILATTKGT
jgi:pimeloyl-ACP methyl ester carboxylesterase